MKALIFAVGALVLSLAASFPARADFTVIRFGSGYCQIWWDSTATPWGAGWTKIAVGLPNADAAHAVLRRAVAYGVCLD